MCCGCNNYLEFLEFYHNTSSDKKFRMALGGLTRSWNKLLKEIEKCDLLRANCHRERHIKERFRNNTEIKISTLN